MPLNRVLVVQSCPSVGPQSKQVERVGGGIGGDSRSIVEAG